ncbi:MAG: hypothetical protein LLF76_02455 [Planctomycetaceae bacterium]|nr:hypothetical protein [Planctomycetaceae bacterium]
MNSLKHQLYGVGLVCLIGAVIVGYALIAPAKKSPAERGFPELQLANDILKLGREIATMLDEVETVEQAKPAIAALEPLGTEYSRLNKEFMKFYFNNGGPTLNKFTNLPKDVQRNVFRFLSEMQEIASNALYELSGRNLPRQTKTALADASGFNFYWYRLTSNKSQYKEYYRRMDAPYIPPDPNTLPDPNKPTDPNLRSDPNRRSAA